jgi:parallel beta-helix repeat protein
MRNAGFLIGLPLIIAGSYARHTIAADQRLERDDTLLTASATFAKDLYRVPDLADDGVLRIQGDDLTIDFQGATLDGAADGAAPNHFRGRGIVIEDSARVVLRNLKVRGYKIAIVARNCRDLVIEDCDVSDNWKQRLLSTPQAENGADWLFGHENDQNEWFRYGAGIYLDGCRGFTVRNTSGRRGQNGLCLVRSNEGRVYDNDFSFNSGWGMAMYRSCDNQIARNKLDWCIRGYSHGVYNRGQDSAGILVYEQCHRNVFAYNSATHGGDGFFLFAGLETLDETGEGGCNDNLVIGNDFSHASNNGIEATFSTGNRFIENVMDEADHAIWAGYSYGTQFIGNQISRCNHGVSIEHGSDNTIEGNSFADTGVAVNLWAGEQAAFAQKPYGKFHHCRSEGYEISLNQFRDCRTAIRLGNTAAVSVIDNQLNDCEIALRADGRCPDLELRGNNISGDVIVAPEVKPDWKGNHFVDATPPGARSTPNALPIDPSVWRKSLKAPDAPGKQNAFLPNGALRGLKYILVDEWGPYDFTRIKLVPEQRVFWEEAEIRILGPDTPFRISGVQGGIEIAPSSGTLPAVLKVTSPDRTMREFSFQIEFPDRNEQLTADGLLLYADWDVTFYRWPRVGPMQPPADWAAVLKSGPLQRRTLPKIDFTWGGDAPSDKVPSEHFATRATTELRLPAGKYEIRTVSDDGIRVSVDGRRVIDNWTWHPPTQDTAVVELDDGDHAVAIEHFEIDGVAQLQFWITPLK